MVSVVKKRILRANCCSFQLVDYAFPLLNTYVLSMNIGICWFRKDLRLKDNPAWAKACTVGPVIAVFVLERTMVDSASELKRQLLYSHVSALQSELRDLGGDLLVVSGPAAETIPELVHRYRVTDLYFNDDPSPISFHRDETVIGSLDIQVSRSWGNLVHPPGSVVTNSGSVHKIFTPFYTKWLAKGTPLIVEAAQPVFADYESTNAFEVQPSQGMTPGSSGAHERLASFVTKISDYAYARDYPSIDGTSRLSADLHFGTIGPREILNAVNSGSMSAKPFVRQLAWRDWYAHLMVTDPKITTSPAKDIYEGIAWRDDPTSLKAWETGMTGYPIVDAGMRELNATGFMHNRVRMVAGSFLVKHLLIDWRAGERYFRHALLDGDRSQNVGNWQWVAGTGFDAAPYFRIFNPIRQSEKFDREGLYIRKWVPELSSLNDKEIHAPWTINPALLRSKGVELGLTYPHPIVDHTVARDRCLNAYKSARDRKPQ
tara:strand:- start:841 stop:2301 length:1461 start_codon:yes stop_codon:yes gene_type:complete